jgi:hypothetical protein
VTALALIVGILLSGIDRADANGHGVIIEANIDSAVVVIDSAVVGTTPARIDSLRPGVHHIIILDPDIAAWPGEGMRDSIIVRPDTVLTYRYDLRKRYFVTSDPGGADVFFRDSLYGKTPLFLPSVSRDWLSLVRIRKEGYPEVHPVRTGSGILTARFREEWEPESSTEPLMSEQSSAPLYLSGAATIISGTAAAYFKIKADNRYQQYLATNNPAFLSETHSIDSGAAVAIVLTQISVIMLVYFLLKE